MPAEGGPARRLTWFGPDVMVRGWTPEGHVLFVTTHGQPFFRNYRAFNVGPRGRHAATAAAGTGQSPRAGTRQRECHRPQHGGPRALEALSRRHGRAPVDRRERQRHVPADDGTVRQHHQPDVGRRPRVLPVGRRGRGQSLLLQARRLGPAPAHRSRRLLRAARADRRRAHRLPVRRGPVVLRSQGGHDAPDPGRRARASHAGGAQVRARRGQPGRIRRAPGGAQPRARRARQARHVRAVGRRGAPARHGGRRAASPRAVARRRRDARRRQRRDGRGARARVEGRRGAHAAVGRGPRDRAARGAARRAGGDRQPSQRGAAGRRRHRRADRGRPQRRGTHRGSRVVAGRRLDRVPVLDRRAALRDQALRRREQDGDARHAAGVPRLRARVRRGGPLPVFPVGAHVRPGVRQRAVRAVVPARRAAVPDRAAGRRAAAVRSGAEGAEAGGSRRRRQGRRGEGVRADARRPRPASCAAWPRFRWPRASSGRSRGSPATR